MPIAPAKAPVYFCASINRKRIIMQQAGLNETLQNVGEFFRNYRNGVPVIVKFDPESLILLLVGLLVVIAAAFFIFKTI